MGNSNNSSKRKSIVAPHEQTNIDFDQTQIQKLDLKCQRSFFQQELQHFGFSWIINEYCPQFLKQNLKATAEGITELTFNTDSEFPQKISTIIKSCPNLKRLSFLNYSHLERFEHIAMRLSMCTSLQEIFISNFQYTLLFLKYIPNLKKIGRTEMDFIDDLKKLMNVSSHLEKIDIQFNIYSINTLKNLISHVQKMKNLNSLNLRFQLNDVPDQVISLLTFLPACLKQIMITRSFETQNQSPSNYHLAKTLSKLNNLERISVTPSSLGNLDAKALGFMNIKNLKTLELNSIIFNSDQLLKLCSNHTHLEELIFDKCDINDQTIVGIDNLKSLKHLRISQQNITHIGIRTFVRNNPQLLRLTLRQCQNIDDKAIIIISNHLPQLQQLKIISISGLAVVKPFTSKGVTYLRKLRKLKKLSINFKNTQEEIVTKIMLNMKFLPVYQFQGEQKFFVAGQNAKRTIKNIRQSTKVWIRGFQQRRFSMGDF